MQQRETYSTYLEDEGGESTVIGNDKDSLTVIHNGHPVNDVVYVDHALALSETILIHSSIDVDV